MFFWFFFSIFVLNPKAWQRFLLTIPLHHGNTFLNTKNIRFSKKKNLKKSDFSLDFTLEKCHHQEVLPGKFLLLCFSCAQIQSFIPFLFNYTFLKLPFLLNSNFFTPKYLSFYLGYARPWVQFWESPGCSTTTTKKWHFGVSVPKTTSESRTLTAPTLKKNKNTRKIQFCFFLTTSGKISARSWSSFRETRRNLVTILEIPLRRVDSTRRMEF